MGAGDKEGGERGQDKGRQTKVVGVLEVNAKIFGAETGGK